MKKEDSTELDVGKKSISESSNKYLPSEKDDGQIQISKKEERIFYLIMGVIFSAIIVTHLNNFVTLSNINEILLKVDADVQNLVSNKDLILTKDNKDLLFEIWFNAQKDLSFALKLDYFFLAILYLFLILTPVFYISHLNHKRNSG